MCAWALIFFRCRNNFYPTFEPLTGLTDRLTLRFSTIFGDLHVRKVLCMSWVGKTRNTQSRQYSTILCNMACIQHRDIQAICTEASSVLVHPAYPSQVESKQNIHHPSSQYSVLYSPETIHIVQHSQPVPFHPPRPLFPTDHRLPSDPDSTGNPASLLMASLLALTSSASFIDSALDACFARSFSASAWTVHTAHRLALLQVI